MAATFKNVKYLDDIEKTGIGEDGIFSGDYVRHVKSATSSLLDDMCIMSGERDSFKLFPATLNKPSIPKAQLVEWLHTAVFLLDRCSLPLMDLAVDQKAEFDELKDEKICDQKKIIELQSKLIEKKNEEVNSVKKSVETELKLFSSVVKQSCSSALAPKKIASAVKKVTTEEDRSCNVILFGVPEEHEEKLDSKVNVLLEQLEEKPQILNCCRIGEKKPDSARPVRFRVKTSAIVHGILRKAKQLKDLEGYQKIFISPDRTVQERVEQKKLIGQLKDKRQSDLSKHFVIRRGEIVCVE